MIEALVVTNMYPTQERPAFGSFVHDQVRVLQAEPDIQLELFAFTSANQSSTYIQAFRKLKQRFSGRKFDIVHAHFGLTIWPSFAVTAGTRFATLHGTDLHHQRSRCITLAALPWVDTVGVPSQPFQELLPKQFQQKAQLLPCGIDTNRFHPIDRYQARNALNLDPKQPYAFFPFDPNRTNKRFDLAQQAVAKTDAKLLYAGNIPPEQMPLFINAANVVICPTERESFGLAVLEALACQVPVAATPVGIHIEALTNLEDALCSDWNLDRWHSFANHYIQIEDPRIKNAKQIQRFSAETCAQNVAQAWRKAIVSN